MGAKSPKVLETVSGWEAVQFILKSLFIGVWQFFKIAVKRLWKGHRRKYSKNVSQVELTVDHSIGTHCYIKIMGVKYHYVENGPKSGQIVLILGDAPDSKNVWGPHWSGAVKRLTENGYHVITLDLRGTGGSEGGNRAELSPPRAVEELCTLLKALGVTEDKPAVVIGFGIGGMLTWYLVHSHGNLISKFVVIGAPHPSLYWQYPPASFCHKALYFIQWPYLPERWLAEEELHEGEGSKWASSRASDWTGALNYVRGAAWYRVREGSRVAPAALLVGGRSAAVELVASAQRCTSSELRLVGVPGATDTDLPRLVTDFLIVKDKLEEEEPLGLVGRVLGAVAGRGRQLTARAQAHVTTYTGLGLS